MFLGKLGHYMTPNADAPLIQLPRNPDLCLEQQLELEGFLGK